MDYKTVIGIYKILERKRGWVSGRDIWDILKEETGKVNKRVFYHYLIRLEEEGIIESKKEGRNKFYKLKGNIFSYTDYAELGYLLFHLMLSHNIIRKNNKNLLINLLKKFIDKEKDFETFIERNAVSKEHYFFKDKKDFEKLGRIFSLIVEEKEAHFRLKEGSILRLKPVKLFLRNGEIILVAYKGRRKLFINLHEIETFTPHYSSNTYKPICGLTDSFEKNAFIFGIKFHKVYMHPKIEPEIFFPTQFYKSIEGDYYVYYLVGYTSDNFVQNFLPILYDTILPPTLHMLKIARKFNLKECHPSLDLKSLRENKSRFYIFLEILEKHLDMRNAIVKSLKSSLQNQEE